MTGLVSEVSEVSYLIIILLRRVAGLRSHIPLGYETDTTRRIRSKTSYEEYESSRPQEQAAALLHSAGAAFRPVPPFDHGDFNPPCRRHSVSSVFGRTGARVENYASSAS